MTLPMQIDFIKQIYFLLMNYKKDKFYKLVFRLNLKDMIGESPANDSVIINNRGCLADYTSRVIAMLNKWYKTRLGFKFGVLLLIIQKVRLRSSAPGDLSLAEDRSFCVLILCFYLCSYKA